jgi:arylformamidase
MSDAVFEYMTGQLRPGHATLLPEMAQRSAATRAALPHDHAVPYGEHQRCRFDFFPAGPGAPVVAFYHAGYWQSRDNNNFLFLAEPFIRAGIAWAAVNYPLCPDVDFDNLMQAAHAALPAIRAHAGRPARVVAAGHSAGGHIAAELGLAGTADAVASLSGVFDLAPLLETPLNKALGLDAGSARLHSPLFRTRPGLPPACFIVGGTETAAFQDQTTRMASAWPGPAITGPGADHFTLLDQLADDRSAVFAAVAALAAG